MPIDALSVSCAQLTRDLLAIAKFVYYFVGVELKVVALCKFVWIALKRVVDGRSEWSIFRHKTALDFRILHMKSQNLKNLSVSEM